MKMLPLTEAKARLSSLVDEVASRDEQITITRKGRRAAVLVNPDYLDSLQETLEIMSDPKLMARLRRTLRRISSGKAKWYTHEQVFGGDD